MILVKSSLQDATGRVDVYLGERPCARPPFALGDTITVAGWVDDDLFDLPKDIYATEIILNDGTTLSVGAYLGARWPAGDLVLWGMDMEGLYAPRGIGDFIAAGQAVLEWPLHGQVEIPERFGIWLGARAGVLVEADRFEQEGSSAGDTRVEAYPTAGIAATGVRNAAPRIGLESRLTVDVLSATRIALGVGARIR